MPVIPVHAGRLDFKGPADPTIRIERPLVRSLAFTGLALSVAIAVAIPARAVAFTGQTPAIASGTSIAVPVGAVALNGLTPSLGLTVAVPVGAVACTGSAPTVSSGSGTTIAVPVGAIHCVGLLPAFEASDFGTVVRTATGTGASGEATATLSVAATAGNLLVFSVSRSAATTTAWGTPSGWTDLPNTPTGSGNMGAAAWCKVAAGGETTVTTVSDGESGSWCSALVEYKGPFESSPVGVTAEDEAHIAATTTSKSSGTTGETGQNRTLAVAYVAIDSGSNFGTRQYTQSFAEVVASTSGGRAAVVQASRVFADFATVETTLSYSSGGGADEMYGAVAVFSRQRTGSVPTIAPNTDDGASFLATSQPTLEATASDADGDDVRYQFRISDNVAYESGSRTTDNWDGSSGTTFVIHPNPHATDTAWTGDPQVDDRPGQSFTAEGGILDSVQFYFGAHETTPSDTDGAARVRVYAHQGTFGSASEPFNAADFDDTPTPGWLAASDDFSFNPGADSTKTWRTFTFSGANRVRLTAGVKYVAILDWIPVNRTSSNTIAVNASSSGGHAGNAYIDGYVEANNGPRATDDVWFTVQEVGLALTRLSGTDAGFANTVSGGDTDPFNEAEKVGFTVQSGDALDDGTYYWDARAYDPTGSGAYSSRTTQRSFVVGAIAVPAGSLAWSGAAASIGGAVAIAVPAGQVDVVGLAVSVGLSIELPAGALAMAGATPAVGGAVGIAIPAGSLPITGYVADVVGSGAIAVPAGSLPFTGYASALSLSIVVPVGAIGLTGQAPDRSVGLTVAVPVGALTLTGTTTTLARAIDLPSGALGWTGQTPAVGGSIAIAIPVGAVQYVGHAVSGAGTIQLPAGALSLVGVLPHLGLGLGVPAGTVAYTGQAPGMSWVVVIPAGSLSVVGRAATVNPFVAEPLEYVSVPAQDRWFAVAAQDRWFVV